ncbi:hypothetical protein HB904_17750 [Listeria booriae]|uniref:Uncharacterized protein n=1 Tax=Listeria booriae TaxID=1552123 RepID=A0A842AG45_9LIST|nr:hypothetical protein [Listeria booriae]MBC1618026.1 hypothetical protein [Listeria booriae]MDT0112150.1 hypothetical protein [Listeria booriae]
MRVVKKPIEAVAIQWKGADSKQDLIDFCGSEEMFEKWFCYEGEELYIDSLEGRQIVVKNAFIVRGNYGEYWSIKEQMFRNNYTILPDEDETENYNNFQDRKFEPR